MVPQSHLKNQWRLWQPSYTIARLAVNILVPAVPKLPNNSALWSKYLDSKSKINIYISFIRGNFQYCPLVWHFCVKTNNNKLEKIQEWSLRILDDTYELSYDELLEKNGSSTLLLHKLKLLRLLKIQIFPCHECKLLHNVSKFNCTSHRRRSVKLV